MYILDTCVLTAIFRNPTRNTNLETRIRATAYENLWISVVSIEEYVRGLMERFRNLEKAHRPIDGYRLLLNMMTDLTEFQILPFDHSAAAVFESMPAKVKRVGKRDCRIASSAISRRFRVITMNSKDFERIPGVQCEDWTAT